MLVAPVRTTAILFYNNLIFFYNNLPEIFREMPSLKSGEVLKRHHLHVIKSFERSRAWQSLRFTKEKEEKEKEKQKRKE